MFFFPSQSYSWAFCIFPHSTMQHLPSTTSLSEALIVGQHALICHNPDEEMGFAGKENTELLPDIRKYTCRAVLTVTRHPASRRIVPIPADCEATVRSTLDAVRERIGLQELLAPESIIGVPFGPSDSLVAALLEAERESTQHPLSSVDCMSYTMYSPQVAELHRQYPNLTIPGDLRTSEVFNNKALAAGLCRRLWRTHPSHHSGLFSPRCTERVPSTPATVWVAPHCEGGPQCIRLCNAHCWE